MGLFITHRKLIAMNQSHDFKLQTLWVLLILALTISIYIPGLHGDFVFDSDTNIVANESLHIDAFSWQSLKSAALSSYSGPLGRPIPVASFALNHLFSGLDPFAYKLTNLLIHCINGVIIFLITLKLLTFLAKDKVQPENKSVLWVALCVSAVWLLHPVNLTNVLYVVQRMNSTSMLFVLTGILSYTIGRTRSLSGKPYFAATLVIPTLCTLLAVLCKENGALLPAYLFILEITVFHFRSSTPSTGKLLAGYYILALLIPGLVVLTLLIVKADWLLSLYEIRDFTLVERLLTEARVVWSYVGMIFIPNSASYGLFLDDIVVSRSVLDPVTTLPAVIALFLAAGIALYTRKRAPVLSLGIMFFLAGHLVESTIYPLELAYEHRNYLPSYGLLLAFFYYLLSHGVLTPQRMKVRRLGAVVFICIFSLVTFMRSVYWADEFELSIAEQTHHPLSSRANIMLGIKYGLIAEANEEKRDQFYELAKGVFLKEASLGDNATDGLFQLILFSSILDRPIDPDWVSVLETRLEHEAFKVNNVNLISAMVSCQLDSRCSLPDDTVISLNQAALRNQSARGRIAAELYTAASKYSLVRLSDIESALFLIAQAAEAMPEDPRYRVHLVKLLIGLNRLDDANDEIERVAALDTLGKESAITLELQQAIREARPGPYGQ